MKFRLLVAILMVLLAAEGSFAGQPTPAKVGVAFFYTNDDTGAVALAAMQTLDQELSLANVTYYPATTHAGHLESTLSAYGIDAEPPLAFIGNTWFSLTGTVPEIEATIQQVKATILTIATMGGSPCPLDASGRVRFPRSVCVLAAYNGSDHLPIVAPYLSALEENISFLHLTPLNTAYPKNQTLLQEVAARLGHDLTPPLLVVGESVWNVSTASVNTVVADVVGYQLVGLDCPLAEKGDGTLCMIFFYSPTCHTCMEAKDALEDLALQYPLNITFYTTLSDTGLDLLFKYYNAIDVPDAEKGSFALFFSCHEIC